MKNIGILYHPRVEATREKAVEMETVLKKRGVSVWVGSAWEKEAITARLDDTDLLVTVGGDGTILRAVQAVVPRATPIAGINLGKLGFMTELDAQETPGKIMELVEGTGWNDARAMLEAKVITPGEKSQEYHALNDIVVARGEIVRLIRIQVAIDGQTLTTYKVDGLIAATATGSTGYALAAGGPVLHPQSRDIILVPVAPHLSPAYPLVLPEASEVTLRLITYHPAVLCVDGHINLPLASDAVVTIRRSPHAAVFRRIRPRDAYYDSLVDKLRGTDP